MRGALLLGLCLVGCQLRAVEELPVEGELPVDMPGDAADAARAGHGAQTAVADAGAAAGAEPPASSPSSTGPAGEGEREAPHEAETETAVEAETGVEASTGDDARADADDAATDAPSSCPAAEALPEACGETPRSCRRFHYDAEGRETLRGTIGGCDDTSGFQQLLTYAPDGRPASYTIRGWHGCRSFVWGPGGDVVLEGYDSECDGTPDRGCNRFQYDVGGDRVAAAVDGDCDGQPDAIDCATTRTIDAEGRVIAESHDPECVGPEATHCSGTDYDEQGRELLRHTDEDCDGAPDAQCLVSIHDDDARRSDSHWDAECDGIPDGHCSYELRDAQGHVLERASDFSCDGVYESDCERNEYDDAGQLVLSEHGCGETPDWWLVFGYDAQGRETLHEYHDAGELSERIARTFDDDGNATTTRYRPATEHTAAHCETSVHDTRGVELSKEQDEGCDGALDLCFTLVPTEDGWKNARWDQDCDGQADHCEGFRLDEDGTRIGWHPDPACSGVPQSCQVLLPLPGSHVALPDSDCDGQADGPEGWTHAAGCTVIARDGDGRVTATALDADCDGSAETCTAHTQGDDGHTTVEVCDFGA